MNWGRRKNRILQPQKQTADEVRRSVRVRGKEQKDGGRPMWLDLEAKPLTQALEAGRKRLRNSCPARQALPSGGGGCAAHRPPHQKGRMTNAGKNKSVATALIKASRNEVPGAAKGMAKHAREAFQNPAQPSPKPHKIDGRGGSESQNAPKRHPRPAKRRPRTPKKCPRAPQEAAKRAQEPPQSAQKPTK